MLGWIKKPEGSDIRAAINLLRELLRQRVLEARRVAGPRIHAAGTAVVAGLRAAGALVTGGARAGLGAASFGAQRIFGRLAATASEVWEKFGTAMAPTWQKVRTATVWASGKFGAVAGLVWQKLRAAAMRVSETLGTVVAPPWQKLRAGVRSETFGTAVGPVWQKFRAATRSLIDFLARPNVVSTLAAGGAMALGAAIGRYWGAGFDSEVVVMLFISGVLIAPLIPMALRRVVARLPAGRLPRVALVAAVAVLAAGAWFAKRGTSVFADTEVVGRASAVAGDLLTVAGITVRLSGIEAPEREQRCGKDGNKWRCAEAAQSALLRVISERPPVVRCRLRGSDKAGRPLGNCWIDRVDINSELVRLGYVFAESGMFARYTAQEKEARNAKAGMWNGDTLRPAEFLAKAWEEAKRRAPDGCPIKGQVTSGERVYVLPGTPDYERVRVQTSRGDRWFCSEQDAAAAGFKAAQRIKTGTEPSQLRTHAGV